MASVRNSWFDFAEAAATDPSRISPAPTATMTYYSLQNSILRLGPLPCVSCDKLWSRQCVPIWRFDAGLCRIRPLDRAPSSQFANTECHGHPSIRLCDEQAVQDLSWREAGPEGRHASLLAWRQDRRGGRERRGQIDATSNHGSRREGVSRRGLGCR